jgi:ribosome biogenesis GTPase
MQRLALEALGWDAAWSAEAARAEVPLDRLARVVGEQRAQWEVRDGAGKAPAVITGRLRAACEEGSMQRPSVGDWVVLRTALGEPSDGPRVIESVLPRRTKIARKAAGRATREQVIAANVDVVLVVCSLGRDVNERRIERFVAIACNGGATAHIVLSKSDLVDDVGPYLERVSRAAPDAAVHVVSAFTGDGMEALAPLLTRGRTIALLGTSGAGKSTLVNRWMQKVVVETGEVRDDGKGRHTTTSRQLLVIPGGAVLIDTPGLREVGLWTGDEGVAHTFEDLADLAGRCRFSDCSHANEPGCVILEGLEAGTLDPGRVDSWRRLAREQRHVGRQNNRSATKQHKAAERSGSRTLQQRLRDKGRL